MATALSKQCLDRALLLSAPLLSLAAGVPAALALIPDEEDEELVRKARANRAAKLAEQRQTTRSFMESEGLANGKLQKDLIPVQKAVYKLADTGKQLEAGDVKAAARVLSEDWVQDFKAASAKISTSSEAVGSGLDSLVAAAAKGELKQAKKAYVSLVQVTKTFASQAGITSQLQGL